MSVKSDLVNSAKDLLWERGYESMSPSAILERSGAGQGSLYHHFRGKSDLAATALGEISAEVRELNDRTLRSDKRSALANVIEHLVTTRAGSKGCRIGRYANENDVVATPGLGQPIRDYFTAQRESIAAALAQAQRDGDLTSDLNVDDVAVALVAVIQGGYVLSRIYGDDTYLERATTAAASMLQPKRNLGYES
jgi:TetR/AcrR family transcriptional regulator, transcriptional repressor for nem operon